eukprot:gb/GFBE01070581.1/.p1 GENE.gb/GFBE01070581.1/~~gb/GFBE01070581.1/.p1  ORF type:complete len:319 (+),score=51.23 gb/GFBE01070581.1/:1-957(+)
MSSCQEAVLNHKENRPPCASPSVGMSTGSKEVRSPAPSPPRPVANETNLGFPVKNTFIHYGTPMRTPTRSLATPKTVPPNFKPPEELRAALPPFAVPRQPQPAVPEWPGHAAAPQTQHVQAHVVQTAQPPAAQQVQGLVAPRAGIAPLRLFDFLPSPKVKKDIQMVMPSQLPSSVPPPPQMPPCVQPQAQPLHAAPAFQAPYPAPVPPPLLQLSAGTSFGQMPEPPTQAPMMAAPSVWSVSGDAPCPPPPPPLPPVVQGATQPEYMNMATPAHTGWPSWQWAQGPGSVAPAGYSSMMAAPPPHYGSLLQHSGHQVFQQ